VCGWKVALVVASSLRWEVRMLEDRVRYMGRWAECGVGGEMVCVG
jgi:hypothetical protein